MKKIEIIHGFHPEVLREYNGEHIYKVRRVVFKDESKAATGAEPDYYFLENNAIVENLGNNKYKTNWTQEERWGRVEEVELDDAGNETGREVLGFMILRVDRSKGIL